MANNDSDVLNFALYLGPRTSEVCITCQKGVSQMTESKEKEEIVRDQEEDLKQAMETRVKLMHVLQT